MGCVCSRFGRKDRHTLAKAGSKKPQQQPPVTSSPGNSHKEEDMSLGVPSGSGSQGPGPQGGGFRMKVALRPGRSLMDWIRLGNSEKDLAGTKGQVLKVTPQELAAHNTRDDAWTCINGKVYNVTPYMEFHPGGEEELMKGAGKDGTDLFNEIHRWVNFESMLAKCLVGTMTTDGVPSLTNVTTPSPTLSASVGVKTAALRGTFAVPPAPPLKYEWYQTPERVAMVIHTKWKHVTADHVTVHREGHVVSVIVHLVDKTYSLTLDADLEVTDDVIVRTARPSGKIEVSFRKAAAENWRLDSDLPELKFIQTTGVQYRRFELTRKQSVTHDTDLYELCAPAGLRAPVPLGRHLRVRVKVEGTEADRSYTPVPPWWAAVTSRDDEAPGAPAGPPVEGWTFSPELEAQWREGRALYLLIKNYPDGVVTPVISRLQIGEHLELSDVEGEFCDVFLEGVTDLFLFAAGTGFTPMARIIYEYVIAPATPSCHVTLLFFNKTEEDRMCRVHLDNLAAQKPSFKVHHILSSPGVEWTGLSGRIDASIIDSCLPPSSRGQGCRVCVCGPTIFTKETVRLLTEAGLSSPNIHSFLG